MTLAGRRWTPDGFGIASDVSNSVTTRHPNEWPTKTTGAPSVAALRAASTTNCTFAPIWEGKLPAHLPLAIVVVLPKVAKAWRRARAFNAMVRLKISIGSTGQVQTVDILKSSDADDLQDEVVDAVKEAQWPTSKGGLALEWIFAFKR